MSIATSLRGTSRKMFVHFLKVMLGSSEVTQLFLDRGSAQRGRVKVIKSENSGELQPNKWVMTTWTSKVLNQQSKIVFQEDSQRQIPCGVDQ